MRRGRTRTHAMDRRFRRCGSSNSGVVFHFDRRRSSEVLLCRMLGFQALVNVMRSSSSKNDRCRRGSSSWCVVVITLAFATSGDAGVIDASPLLFSRCECRQEGAGRRRRGKLCA